MRPERSRVAAAPEEALLPEMPPRRVGVGAVRVAWDRVGLPLAFALVFVLFAATANNFFTVANMVNVVRQVVTIALVAYAISFAIITGGIDLSVGSNMSLVSVVAAMASKGPLGFAGGLAAGLATGALVGSVNGLIIARTRVQPFIVTLGMATAASGAALVLSDGNSIRDLPGGFATIGFEYVFGVPVSALITLAVAAALWFLLHQTPFGRTCYAVGGNETAAYLSGIRIGRTRFMAYALAGLLVACASIIATARTDSGQPTLGLFVPLQAIAAAVIGGASLGGGRGSIAGTTLGVFFMAFLYNGMNLLGVSIYTQDLLVGCVILAAAGLDAVKRRISG